LDISSAVGGKTLQIVTDDNPQKIRELGVGFGQILIVLSSVAFRKPSFVLIDEPELNLHPALQLKFLSAIARHSANGVLFATHSLGLARTVAETIYSVTRRDHSSIVRAFTETASIPELLGELSYSSMQVVGYDTLLLVEGPSELATIQEFLRKYKKDHRIVMVPLGGSSMINGRRGFENAELKRVAGGNKVAALIDSERNSETDNLAEPRAAFVSDCTKLDIP